MLRGGIPMPLVEDMRAGMGPILEHRGQGRIGTGRHQTILEPESYHPSFKAFLNLPRLNRAVRPFSRPTVRGGSTTLVRP